MYEIKVELKFTGSLLRLPNFKIKMVPVKGGYAKVQEYWYFLPAANIPWSKKCLSACLITNI